MKKIAELVSDIDEMLDAGAIFSVDGREVGAVFDERVDDIRIAGEMKRRVAVGILLIDVGTGMDERGD